MNRDRRPSASDISIFSYLALIGLFMLAPLFFVVVNSFNSAPFSIFPPPGFSLVWYETAFTNSQFRRGLQNSILVGLAAMASALVLGTLAALGLTRRQFLGREMLRSLFLMPLTVPRIVLGISLFLLVIRLRLSGTLLSLVLGHTLLALPFVIIILSATLLSIDRTTEEASADLGANWLQTLMFVTLPQMRVGLTVASLFAFITSFDEVEVSLFLTRPAMNTLPIEMLNFAEQFQDPTLAAVSTILMAFAALLALAAVLVLRTQEYRRLLRRR